MKSYADRMIQSKLIKGQLHLSELWRSCELCGCDMHYADSWASDYGIVCDSCAMAEIDRIGESMLRRIEQ